MFAQSLVTLLVDVFHDENESRSIFVNVEACGADALLLHDDGCQGDG